MKKTTLIFACLLLNLALFGREVRILFVGSSGCSGSWILIETTTGGTTGYGTFDFCRVATNEEPTVIITQGKDENFVAVQPAVFGRALPTMEEIENVKKQAPNLKISPNPVLNGKFTGQLNKDIDMENVQYQIIGYDGRKYSEGKTNLQKGRFSLKTELQKGIYFIILGSPELGVIYNSNFLISK